MQEQPLDLAAVEAIEEYYKQGMASTVSVPRVLLLLYERSLRLLRLALAAEGIEMQRGLVQAQKVLGQMLELLLQSPEADQALYQSHLELSQSLSQAYRRNSKELLRASYAKLELYYGAWQEELQIRNRFAEPQAARLNVKRHPDSAPDLTETSE